MSDQNDSDYMPSLTQGPPVPRSKPKPYVLESSTSSNDVDSSSNSTTSEEEELASYENINEKKMNSPSLSSNDSHLPISTASNNQEVSSTKIVAKKVFSYTSRVDGALVKKLLGVKFELSNMKEEYHNMVRHQKLNATKSRSSVISEEKVGRIIHLLLLQNEMQLLKRSGMVNKKSLERMNRINFILRDQKNYPSFWSQRYRCISNDNMTESLESSYENVLNSPGDHFLSNDFDCTKLLKKYVLYKVKSDFFPSYNKKPINYFKLNDMIGMVIPFEYCFDAIMFEFLQLLQKDEEEKITNPKHPYKVYGKYSIPFKCQVLQNEMNKYSGILKGMAKTFYDCIECGYTKLRIEKSVREGKISERRNETYQKSSSGKEMETRNESGLNDGDVENQNSGFIDEKNETEKETFLTHSKAVEEDKEIKHVHEPDLYISGGVLNIPKYTNFIYYLIVVDLDTDYIICAKKIPDLNEITLMKEISIVLGNIHFYKGNIMFRGNGRVFIEDCHSLRSLEFEGKNVTYMSYVPGGIVFPKEINDRFEIYSDCPNFSFQSKVCLYNNFIVS